MTTTPRVLVAATAISVAVIVAFYAEEDFRGRRAWMQYRQQAQARGEQLDWKAFIPKPVPDELNFAAIPLIKSWFVRSNYLFAYAKYGDDDNYGRASAAALNLSVEATGYRPRDFSDLVEWKTAFDAVRAGKPKSDRDLESGRLDHESRAKAAPAVLEELKTNEADFAELRAASQRPYSRYPIKYDVPNPLEIRLPHLSSVRAICRRLQLKACAELALGRSEDALEDVKLSLYLADSVKDEPLLISYLVRVACLQIATQPIWEGLAEHAWTDAELRELETRLQEYDFVTDLKPALDAERAWGIVTIEYIEHTGDDTELASLFLSQSSPWGWSSAVWRSLPSGWYDFEQLNYCTLHRVALEGTYEPSSRRVSPSRIAANSGKLVQAFDARGFAILLVHHRFMSGIMLSGLDQVVRKGAAAQIATDQAVLACALERYRLANGHFPEGLEALTPQFVTKPPDDVITGEPYKYRRTENGQFVLYSVGWNEKDDDGVPGRTLFDQEAGDWVWQYPSKP